jgi:hypothetical protein
MTLRDSRGSLDVDSRPHGLPHAFISSAPLQQQYFARSSPGTVDGPEHRLLFAVLVNAIIQLRSRNAHDVIEAETWIRADEISDSPFSFDSICEVLGIEPRYLARGLLTWSLAHGVRRPPLRQIRASRARIAPTPRRPRPATGRRRLRRTADGGPARSAPTDSTPSRA